VRVFDFLQHLDAVELDVEKLVDRLERSAYLDVVLQLHCDFMVHQRLEKAEK